MSRTLCNKYIYPGGKICFFAQVARLDKNESFSEETLKDDDYMLVDELQRLTDEYVSSVVNLTAKPKLIWRPFLESLFKDIITLDLDNKDQILVGNLAYLKKTALLLVACEEQYLGISGALSYRLKFIYMNITFYYKYVYFSVTILRKLHLVDRCGNGSASIFRHVKEHLDIVCQ